jgi:hypothetical protein
MWIIASILGFAASFASASDSPAALASLRISVECREGRGRIAYQLKNESAEPLRIRHNVLPWSSTGDVISFQKSADDTSDAPVLSAFRINDDDSLVEMAPGETLVGYDWLSNVIRYNKGSALQHDVILQWKYKASAIWRGERRDVLTGVIVAPSGCVL